MGANSSSRRLATVPSGKTAVWVLAVGFCGRWIFERSGNRIDALLLAEEQQRIAGADAVFGAGVEEPK